MAGVGGFTQGEERDWRSAKGDAVHSLENCEMVIESVLTEVFGF